MHLFASLAKPSTNTHQTKTTNYDTLSKQETVVMDSTNEIEIYSMSYSQKKNAIKFAGMRFSDNKHVVGEVSLS